ncbi:MAG: DUF2214 family protein [Terricaulis sp.]|nr:DUF2214 family protein [Terricaulis sp.]
MILDAALSYLHFVFAFLIVGALCAELFMLRLPIGAAGALRMLRADLFYGAGSVLLLLAGGARVLWGRQGLGVL